MTDIARDGVMTGPNFDLLAEVAGGVGIPIIASGGIGSLDDVEELCANAPKGVEGVIVGKAIYEGRVELSEAIAMGRRTDPRGRKV